MTADRASGDHKGSHARTRHFRVTVTSLHSSSIAAWVLRNTLANVGNDIERTRNTRTCPPSKASLPVRGIITPRLHGCSADTTRQSSPRSGSTTFVTNLSTRHLWHASSAMCIQTILLGWSLFELPLSIALLQLVRHVQPELEPDSLATHLTDYMADPPTAREVSLQSQLCKRHPRKPQCHLRQEHAQACEAASFGHTYHDRACT